MTKAEHVEAATGRMADDFVTAGFCELCNSEAPRAGDTLMGDMREDADYHWTGCAYRHLLAAKKGLHVSPQESRERASVS